MNKSESRLGAAWRQFAWTSLGWLLGSLALVAGATLLNQIEGDIQHAQAATETAQA